MLNFDKRETVLLPGPAGKLEVVINRPRGEARGIALIAHPHPLHGGTLDNKVVQTLASTFAELDCTAFRMNFRGIGQSEGTYDEGVGETDDMLFLADHAKRECGELPILLAGFSFGGFVQTRVATKLDIRKLVLIAPAVGRFDVAEVKPDTLVIHGELDETVPLKDVMDWARPQHLPIVVIPGADHFFHKRLQLIKQLVAQACRFWGTSN
ncbi:MAG: alpha/beta hydrolase [Burkholderiales bacterium]|nr:alpha/beta hydrolase [Pseudomonadota bacterium]